MADDEESAQADTPVDSELLERLELSLFRAMGKADLKVVAVPDIAVAVAQDLKPQIAARAELLAGESIGAFQSQADAKAAEVEERHRMELTRAEETIAALEERLKVRLPRQMDNENLKKRVAALSSDLKEQAALAKKQTALAKQKATLAEKKAGQIRELELERQEHKELRRDLNGLLHRDAFHAFFGGYNDAGALLEELLRKYSYETD